MVSVSRRNLLQGAAAVSALGVVGLAGCTGADESTSAATGSGSIELAGGSWSYDETNDVYYQIGVSYVAKPAAADYETLGVYVPGAYLSGTKNSDGSYTAEVNTAGKVGDYTAATAPIVIPLNTPGYAAQQPPTEYTYDDVSEYLAAGLIYVLPGLRGKDSNTDAYVGNAPWGVTDLKAAVRFVRYNAERLPGDKAQIFVFGHSGGGAQSAIAGSSGDSTLYTPYLESLGAAMKDSAGADLSDALAGAMCWCPITSLDYADAAYEWNLGQFADTGTRAAGTWTAAYSADLAAAYADHINSLGLKSSGKTLKLSQSSSGEYLSGSYYDYVVSAIETSLNNFLSDTEFPYTVDNSFQAGMGGSGGPSGDGSGGPPSGDQSGAAPSGGGSAQASSSSSASATTYQTVADYIDDLNSSSEWVKYNASANTAKVLSLAGFVQSQKSPSKDVGAFDAPDRSATENVVLGSGESGLHFSPVAAAVMTANQDSYTGLTDWSDDYGASAYTEDFAKTDGVGTAVPARLDSYTPLYYLSQTYDGYQSATVAPHWRIRTGIKQGDTANTVELNLALALEQYGVEDVDFATVWGLGHTQAERTGDATTNFIEWVKSVAS